VQRRSLFLKIYVVKFWAGLLFQNFNGCVKNKLKYICKKAFCQISLQTQFKMKL